MVRSASHLIAQLVQLCGDCVKPRLLKKSRTCAWGFTIWGRLGLLRLGLGFWGLGFGLLAFGFRVLGLGSRIWAFALGA